MKLNTLKAVFSKKSSSSINGDKDFCRHYERMQRFKITWFSRLYRHYLQTNLRATGIIVNYIILIVSKEQLLPGGFL